MGATYFHFFVSTLVWSGTAFLSWKFGLVPSHPWAPVVIGILGMFLIFRLHSLDYDADRYKKVVTFHLFSAMQGSMLAVILLKCQQLEMLDIVVQAAVLTSAGPLCSSLP